MTRTSRKSARSTGTFRPTPTVSLLLLLLLALAAGCSPHQQQDALVDAEPERLVATDLSFPKNPTRWAYVSSHVVLNPADPFPGFRVVTLNPFAARAREEGERVERGAKLAQTIYEAQQEPQGIRPGALRRINIMVQDPDRYADTDGWGYASFDENGRPIPISARTDCVTCHTSGPLSLGWPQ